jgi:hypothetical protein
MACSLRSRTIDSAATLRSRSLDSEVSTVRSMPSPSKTYGKRNYGVSHGAQKENTYESNLRCTLGAFLHQLQYTLGAFLDCALGNFAGLDRTADQVKGTPFVDSGHLEVESCIESVVNAVSAEPIAHNLCRHQYNS